MTKAKVIGQFGVRDVTLFMFGFQPKAGPIKQEQSFKALMLRPEIHTVQPES